MEMTVVKSSNIHSVGYENGTLKVRFHSGSEYEYADVSKADHDGLMDAESKGRWLSAFVAARSGATQTKKPEPKPARKEVQTVKAETVDGPAFAGRVMRSQISRTPRASVFQLPRNR